MISVKGAACFLIFSPAIFVNFCKRRKCKVSVTFYNIKLIKVKIEINLLLKDNDLLYK